MPAGRSTGRSGIPSSSKTSLEPPPMSSAPAKPTFRFHPDRMIDLFCVVPPITSVPFCFLRAVLSIDISSITNDLILFTAPSSPDCGQNRSDFFQPQLPCVPPIFADATANKLARFGAVSHASSLQATLPGCFPKLYRGFLINPGQVLFPREFGCRV